MTPLSVKRGEPPIVIQCTLVIEVPLLGGQIAPPVRFLEDVVVGDGNARKGQDAG